MAFIRHLLLLSITYMNTRTSDRKNECTSKIKRTSISFFFKSL